VIDLHSHLLPGVDDGSRSFETSVAVLSKFAEQGVECVVLTPHLNVSRMNDAPYERHVEILEKLRAKAPSAPELKLGWEIMLDEPGRDLRSPRLSLGGSNAVLVEFPLSGVPAQGGAELYRIRCSDVVPVLAHPERYWGCTVAKVEHWRKAGAVIQMDTAGLLGKGRIAKISRELLEHGLVDLFSSDNHGD
jgi:protein-tyrosine phosphatase